MIGQNRIMIEGVVKDNNGYEVPYAAVSIPSKSIGTSTTEDGSFFLNLSLENLSDVLEVSSIGFKTYKITIEAYLATKEKINVGNHEDYKLIWVISL